MPAVHVDAHPAGAGHRPQKVLLCVGSDNSGLAALGWVRQNLARMPSAEFLLLAVLPPPERVRSRGMLLDMVRHELANDGRRRLVPVASELARSGTRYSAQVEIADEVEAVLRCASEQSCDLIVLTATPVDRASRWWQRLAGMVGSTASRVAAFADRPVLVCHAGTC